MITTVALNAYNLDSYPEASGEVSAWINMARTVSCIGSFYWVHGADREQTGGFIISYFQVTWANAQGTKVSFGIQAAICAAAFFIIVALQFVGKKLRIKSGPLNFATA
jgi:hypothetical protein